MKEIFHTEDCALSLICRCCRGPVCDHRLAKSDRMARACNLWGDAPRSRSRGRSDARTKPNSPTQPGGFQTRPYGFGVFLRILRLLLRWLRIRNPNGKSSYEKQIP